VQPLVGKVGKDAEPIVYQPSPATVLMNTGADIEAGRGDVRGGAVGTRPDDHAATALLRPSFEPVDVITVDANLRQRRALGHDEVGRDRRFPGAVRRDLGRGLGGGHAVCPFTRIARRACETISDLVPRSACRARLEGRDTGSAPETGLR